MQLLQNLPQELLAYRQFVCWVAHEVDGKIKKIPVSPLTGQQASINDPAVWSSFGQALHAATNMRMNGVGFVLTPNDPYTFIDLDVPNDNVEAQAQLNIYNIFNSYSEVSPSGKGLHIIVKGGIPQGCRRGSIEVYSHGRYMTLTGDAYRNVPIMEAHQAQPLLNELYHEIHNSRNTCSTDLELAAVYSPSRHLPPEYSARCRVVWEKAATSKNGALFKALWQGAWNTQYPTQSEADLALMNILAFHTRDVEVIKGLFRQSALGQRPKAMREDYINYTIRRAFDQVVKPVELINTPTLETIVPTGVAPQPVVAEPSAVAPAPTPANPVGTKIKFKRKEIRDLPGLPGVIHELAAYNFEASRNPSPEFALVGAIALMAGICGRAFNVSDTGLNLYMLMLAKTGTGKESIKTNLMNVVSRIADGNPEFELSQVDEPVTPAIREFVSGVRFASGQGLLKTLAEKPSCVFYQDEFGQSLERYHRSHSINDTMIKDILLEAYMSSGAGRILDGTNYSDKAKNTPSVRSPAMSILGLSTPERVINSITPGDIENGFIPRFIIVEKKDDVKFNISKRKVALPKNIITQLSTIVEVIKARKDLAPTNVVFDNDAEELATEHMFWCAKNTQSADSARKELWNRANLNALRLAALLAVGVNYYCPKITLEQMQWAIDFVNSCVFNMLDKFADSDAIGDMEVVGTVEVKCRAQLYRVLRQYTDPNYSALSKRFDKVHHEHGIISHSYILSLMLTRSCYADASKASIGASGMVNRLLEELISSSILEVMDKTVLKQMFDIGGKVYKINKKMLV